MSPAGTRLEEVAAGWLLDVLGLPGESGVGFVTGATMGNFTALAAARHALLARQGWDAEGQGLFGAPPIDVVVGEEVHVSLLKALALLGLGRERVDARAGGRPGPYGRLAAPAAHRPHDRVRPGRQRELGRRRPDGAALRRGA